MGHRVNGIPADRIDSQFRNSFLAMALNWEEFTFSLSVGSLDANKWLLLNLYTGCCRIKRYCPWADYVYRESGVGVAEIG